MDVFAVEPVAPPTVPPTGDVISPGAEEGFNRFLTKSNGVLFENDMLQIGVKSDFKKNLGNYAAHVAPCLSRVYCSYIQDG